MKNRFNLNRNLLLVLFYVLVTSFSYANNVLIKIDDPEGIFNKCTLQRTFYGNISNVPVEQTEPLIIATGTEMELQVDSFLVCFIMVMLPKMVGDTGSSHSFRRITLKTKNKL